MRPALPHRRLLLFLPLVGCVTLVSASGCNQQLAGEPSPAAVNEPAVKEVMVAAAKLEPWPLVLRVQGSLLADEDAVIGSRIAGRIETVNIDLGSIVKRGEPMVVLDRRELELLVAQAEAQLRQACAAIGLTPEEDETQLNFERSPPVMLEQALVDEAQAAVTRAEQLLPGKALSRGEYDTFVAQLKTAQARYLSALNAVSEQVSLIGVRRADLNLARQQLLNAQIMAPFDAIVSQRQVSPGEYVQAGTAVATLVRADQLRFTAGVPESRAANIQLGQKVAINAAENQPPILAAITRVSPMVMLASRSLRIEADVPNPNLTLQAGLFAEAEITLDPLAQTLAVPAAAVSQFAGVQKVWIVSEGRAKQQTVRTGRRDADRYEILEGITGGDLVVANAAEGHNGPVVAIHSPGRADLHAHLPDESTSAPVYE